MNHRSIRHRRPAAALVSAIAILVVVTAFAALLLSVHGVHVSTAEGGIHRLRAEAAALAATQLALWDLSNDADLQAALARVVYEDDASFEVDPLVHVQGDLAGATFAVDVWPGEESVRLQSHGISGGYHVQRWTQMPLRLAAGEDLIVGGGFEDTDAISASSYWNGEATLGKWLAGYGISQLDDPGRGRGARSWNISAAGGNHYAEELRKADVLGQTVAAEGARGTLELAFDYVRQSGRMRVTVRGVDELPRSGWMFRGTSAYREWTRGGTLLYDSGPLPAAASWGHFTASVDAGDGYRYYTVQIEASGGSGGRRAPARAIDNVTLLGE